MDDPEKIAKPPRAKRRHHPLANQEFNARLAALITDGPPVKSTARGRLDEISKGQRDSSGGGGLERVILELRGALRAAEQAQDSESNVDGLRSHAAQHAQQAWLLLTGSVPDRIWGRCDCAL